MKRATFAEDFGFRVAFYFNPRPREEGDKLLCFLRYARLISIHALVKRATRELQRIKSSTEISIHALVKRATLVATNLCWLAYISIHALVKRATLSTCYVNRSTCHFNPRPREEGDLLRPRKTEKATHFNPRPREEGDGFAPSNASSARISIHALVKRATISRYLSSFTVVISIHALVKRATCASIDT